MSSQFEKSRREFAGQELAKDNIADEMTLLKESMAEESSADDDDAFHLGSSVVLVGLTKAKFNGRTGYICEDVMIGGRYAVALAVNKERVSVKPINLREYVLEDAEPCTACNELLLLHEVPCCACSFEADIASWSR